MTYFVRCTSRGSHNGRCLTCGKPTGSSATHLVEMVAIYVAKASNAG